MCHPSTPTLLVTGTFGKNCLGSISFPSIRYFCLVDLKCHPRVAAKNLTRHFRAFFFSVHASTGILPPSLHCATSTLTHLHPGHSSDATYPSLKYTPFERSGLPLYTTIVRPQKLTILAAVMAEDRLGPRH